MDIFQNIPLDSLPFHSWGELGIIFGLLLGGTFGLPVPEDIVVLWAGTLAEQGKHTLEAVFLVCWLAVMAGDTIMYLLGRICGIPLLDNKYVARLVSTERVERARELLERRRFLVIIIARHLFYLRGATFFSCGLVRMRFLSFLAADALAAALSIAVSLALGFLGASYWSSLKLLHCEIKIAALIVGITAVISFVGWQIWKRAKAKSIEQQL